MEVNMSVSADMNFNPSLYQIHLLLDESIVGEEQARMAVFTNWLLAYRNVNLAGQRSSGKTHIADSIAKFLPKKNGLFNVSSGSDKAGWYQAEALKNHSHVMIPELNKMPKDMLEVIKDWGEGKDSEYKVTVMEGGVRSVRKYHLPRKPFIFCLADEQEEKIDDQLRSRLTVIRTDSSEEQNRAVNLQKANFAMMPDNPNKVKDEKLFENVRHHILKLPPYKMMDFRHPGARYFVDCIPTIFTDCRRDFPKYLDNTYGITRFFWKNRMYYEKEDKHVYFVTPQDMYYNHVIYGQTLIESSLRCSNMERHLISVLERANQPLNKKEVQAAVRQMGLNISAHMVTRHLGELSDLGYVNVEKVGNKPAVYSPGKLFSDFDFEINWKNLVEEAKENMRKYYPDYAEEYIQKFCENPMVINPFTGVEINLLELKPEKKEKKDAFSEYMSKNEDEETKTEKGLDEEEMDKFEEFVKKEQESTNNEPEGESIEVIEEDVV